MKKNTSVLWDTFWKDESSYGGQYNYKILQLENSVKWRRIEQKVLSNFGTFKNLKVIEIGAGTGTVSALMARKGADVTILDYSENALKSAKNVFRHNKLRAKFVNQDALSLSRKFQNKYDVSMSFGLSEHFKGEKRILINKAHFDLLKKGGITFISVPNKYNPPYRLFKFFSELFRLWRVGEEYPFSRKELRDICRKLGIKEYSFFGDSLFSSLHFINPFYILRRLLKISYFPKVKKERGTFLDEYISYALILYAKK